MTKWEQFEEYLFDQHVTNTSFNSQAVAADLNITRREASRQIQNYLNAQTRLNSNTLFVLTRDGRTRRAMWHVGARAADARGLSRQTADDVKRRFDRFVMPTMRRIGEKNPRALPAARLAVTALEASIAYLMAMADGHVDREG